MFGALKALSTIFGSVLQLLTTLLCFFNLKDFFIYRVEKKVVANHFLIR